MRSYRAGMVVVALAAACNSTTVEDSNEGPAIEESALAQLVAEAQCDQQMSCDCYVEAGPVGEDPVEYTHDKCIENRVLELTYWQGLLRGHGLRYDSDCAARKLASAQSWGCGDAVEVAAIEHDCALRCRVYHGDVAQGGECDPEVDDCSQGLTCRPSEYDPVTGIPEFRCVSTCVDNGALCSAGDCAPGLYCGNATDGNSRCLPMASEGESCAATPCGGASYCNDALVCAAVLENGATCDFTVPCHWNCVDSVCEPGPAQICSWDLRTAYY